MIELDTIGDELGTIDRDEVCCTVDCVDMNYSKIPGAVFTNTWTDHPHASVFVGAVTDLVKPTDESAWIYVPSVLERKEGYDSRNFKPSHPFKVGIGVDEHAVIACPSVPPEWTCTDMFTSHATNAAGIAWGIEHCGSRIKDTKLAFMLRAASSWDVFGFAGIIGVELRKQKVSDEAS